MDSIIENAWASRDLLEKTETQKKKNTQTNNSKMDPKK